MRKSILSELKGEFGHFRKHYEFPSRVNWYPGHMAKAMRQLRSQFLPVCHVIIEVRDARLPVSTQHPEMDALCRGKPRLVVFNKSDLLSDSERARLEGWAQKHCDAFLLGRADSRCKGLSSRLVARVIDLCRERDIQGTPGIIGSKLGNSSQNRKKRPRNGINSEPKTTGVSRHHNSEEWDDLRSEHWSEDETNDDDHNALFSDDIGSSSGDSAVMMAVLGFPNVGKSTVINSLRELVHRPHDSAQVGRLPGVTRHISYFKLAGQCRSLENASLFVLDTPGIFVPSVQSGDAHMKTAMNVAIAGNISDRPLGTVTLADYALFTLNQRRQFRYARDCGLTEPTDNIDQVLRALAEQRGFRSLSRNGSSKGTSSVGIDEERAAAYFLDLFRRGRFGRFVIDDI